MVIHSIEDETGIHCVDIAQQDDGTFTFKAFRKDPEDQGRWTLTADYSITAYATEAAALDAACVEVPWLEQAISGRL